ncbi:MAG: hypothetical protein KC431_29985, partial [Myxococcales bacterium]|nr:hypothetical protein [Myxococcales bacterium]
MQEEGSAGVDDDTARGVGELTGTLPAGLGFRIDDPVEHEREREALAAALFGTAAQQLKIGRFTVLERIGQGGMGTVYAAYDEELDRKVAVKVLRRRGGDGAAAAARLRREAQAMARL